MKINLIRRLLRLSSWIFLLVSASIKAAPLVWFPGPNIGTPMSGSATVYYNGRNVLSGGDVFKGYGSPFSQPVCLTPTNASWTYLTPFASLNIAGGAVVNDGNLIVYGGTDGSNSQSATIAYNFSGDTPPVMPNMNMARSYLGYAPDRSGNGYAIGGLDANSNALASMERLNFGDTASTWTYVASMPVPRYNFPAASDHTNYIYIFGGYTDTVSGVESASVLRYAVNSNTWTAMAPMPAPVAGSAATLAPDGNIYVVGGTCGGTTTNVVQVYDPIANSWTISPPLPEGLSLSALGVDSQNRLILMGGVDTNGNDSGNVWRSQEFGVTDSAPLLVQFPATNAVYLGNYSSFINATSSPPATYTLVSGPAGMQVDYYSGDITWTPQDLAQIGLNPVTIQAANYAGSTSYSFEIKVPNIPPTWPSNITEVSVSDNSATIAWSSPDPAAGPVTYSLAIPHPYHSPKGSGGGVNYQVVMTGIPTNFITFTGLAPGTSTTYALSATGPGGSTGFYYNTWFTFYTTAPQGPASVSLTGLTSTSTSLAWTPSPGPAQSAQYSPVVSYVIMEWKPAPGPNIPTVLNLTGTNGTANGLVPGQSHLWYVAGVDAQGTYSAFTGNPFAYVSVANPVPKPATLASSSSIAPNPDGFQFTVQTSTPQTTFVQATTNLSDPASWTTIATNFSPADLFTFTDTNSSQFTARYYRVITP
ncbi:MAG TPA: kelch repeat-containing protein [Verrucomicrobiae bacterium]|nr:kelch repeat-containing protein [Verrucomicrobiae bacterium]